MAKVFSIEDGNLNNVPITSSIVASFKDIDLSFAKRPDGDVYRKNDAAAVKQSVKNILMTNSTEKPFNPYYGGDLNRFLFDISADYDELGIKEEVINAINNFEPRAQVLGVNVNLSPDYNLINITIEFQVITTMQVEVVEVSLARIR